MVLLQICHPPCIPEDESRVPRKGAKRSLEQDLPGFANIIKSIADVDFVQARETTWLRALTLWLGILEGCDLERSMGDLLFECLTTGNRQNALEIIRDARGTRSPKTVLKRGKDLVRFVKWASDQGLRWWPVNAKHVLAYFFLLSDSSIT